MKNRKLVLLIHKTHTRDHRLDLGVCKGRKPWTNLTFKRSALKKLLIHMLNLRAMKFLYILVPPLEIRIKISLKDSKNRNYIKVLGRKYLSKMRCNSNVRLILLIIIKIWIPNMNSNIQKKYYSTELLYQEILINGPSIILLSVHDTAELDTHMYISVIPFGDVRDVLWPTYWPSTTWFCRAYIF